MTFNHICLAAMSSSRRDDVTNSVRVSVVLFFNLEDSKHLKSCLVLKSFSGISRIFKGCLKFKGCIKKFEGCLQKVSIVF